MKKQTIQLTIFASNLEEFKIAANKSNIDFIVRNSENRNGYSLIEITKIKHISMLFHLGRYYEIQVHRSMNKENPIYQPPHKNVA